MKDVLYGIGLMSGSSLDGLDVALCRFQKEGRHLTSGEVVEGQTIGFPAEWQDRLPGLAQLSGKALMQAHADFGHWLGKEVRALGWEADFIASHGHTVFHFPGSGFTTQIGDGAALAAATGLPVVCDFRSLDVALGGQGAPLAPTVDTLWEETYDYFLNLGGIANISTRIADCWHAFDIGPANQILNRLAALAGQPMDAGGALARVGKVDPVLLERLNSLPFFSQPYPKSLGNDWVAEQVWPLYEAAGSGVEDRLHTAVVQLCEKVAEAIRHFQEKRGYLDRRERMMLSGGGAFNTFLVERLQRDLGLLNLAVEVPDARIVEFKEALLIAMLGALRLWKLPNVRSSVTGADRDSIAGAVYWGAI